MWGDPHISVGRRVERPIQCRKGAEVSQVDAGSGMPESGKRESQKRLTARRHDYRDLPAGIARAMREEAVVVTASAG